MEYHLSPRHSDEFRSTLSVDRHVLRFGLINTGVKLEDYVLHVPLVPNELEYQELLKLRKIALEKTG